MLGLMEKVRDNYNLSTTVFDNQGSTEHATSFTYSPFGKVTKTIGNGNIQPFKFSSEYHDNETESDKRACETSSYNYRYYNPELGSWLSRDQVSEKGGLNLYGFVGNKSVNQTD
jgi:RHS repeat-associated protein